MADHSASATELPVPGGTAPSAEEVSPDWIDPVRGRSPLVEGIAGWGEITEIVARPLEQAPPRGWYWAFGISLSMLALFVLSIAWLLWQGVGVWGNSIPVGWGWPIVNFVFWIGIGHAGTLISAVLLIFHQPWRTSINRTAEAMTLFAVACALIFPGIHTGRPWVAYWLFPIPNQMGLWPQFRSPLMWDVVAVSVYGTVSAIFWYVGLIPDLATLRDRARSRVRQVVYGLASLGWRFSARHWTHYEKTYLLLAGLATPLVISVHSVVSLDFAVSQLPGWHSTIFPPYFVAGAIFSGLAMVVTLMTICRSVFKLERLVTTMHFERIARLLLVTSCLLGYAYLVEFFIAAYSGNPFEKFTFAERALGASAGLFWLMAFCNVLLPQIFWWRRARTSIPVLFTVSLLVNVGMWLERLVIVTGSLERDFLPANWKDFLPTWWDVSTLMGSFGLFFTLFCLFVRYLPLASMAEIKSAVAHTSGVPSESMAAESPDRGASDSLLPLPPAAPGGAFLLAAYDSSGAAARACRALRRQGVTEFEAHTPFCAAQVQKEIPRAHSPIGWWVLAGGLAGAGLGFGLQSWTSTLGYPLLVSGKPLFSWPAFIPIAFESGILGGALAAFAGLLWTCRLPRFFHEIFATPEFSHAGDDHFLVRLSEASSPGEHNHLLRLLQENGAVSVRLVRPAGRTRS